MADDISEPEKVPDVGDDLPEYMVGDYLNLDLTIYHQMHIVEASVVYSHEDDDAIKVSITGEPELEEAELMDLRSVLRVSRQVTLEDVPGTYALNRLELVTASTRGCSRRSTSADRRSRSYRNRTSGTSR